MAMLLPLSIMGANPVVPVLCSRTQISMYCVQSTVFLMAPSTSDIFMFTLLTSSCSQLPRASDGWNEGGGLPTISPDPKDQSLVASRPVSHCILVKPLIFYECFAALEVNDDFSQLLHLHGLLFPRHLAQSPCPLPNGF